MRGTPLTALHVSDEMQAAMEPEPDPLAFLDGDDSDDEGDLDDLL
eukprot:COSAG04_NODE_13624_length_598_cov_0.877756_1_plen_45_part_00